MTLHPDRLPDFCALFAHEMVNTLAEAHGYSGSCARLEAELAQSLQVPVGLALSREVLRETARLQERIQALLDEPAKPDFLL